jgi:hypothetical protein
MTNKGMVVCCLTLLLVHSSGVSTTAAAQTPGSLDGSELRLAIAVFAPPDMTKSLVDRIFKEAKAIWGPTGISLDWYRVTPKDVVRTWQLDVTIDDDPDGAVTEQAALGSILFTADGPEPSIHLFRATAEASILRAEGVGDTSVFTHEILVGRALGRALSHELGHYLLKSKEHSLCGLMRATWRSEEFLAVGRSGFELTSQQREIAAHFVQGARS